jgi:hypothetical protein
LKRVIQRSEQATYGVRGQRLICWIDEGTTDEWQHCRPDALCWFYVLPLASLKNVADVRRLLVRPVVNLLSDGDVGSAFDAAKEVI